ncbi:MAG: HEAT repeat domain-containing protein [Alphaproteobacteria bacterium]|nr:HEAT repeat domain-containing protein [Alphaproteobacteria bacterium]
MIKALDSDPPAAAGPLGKGGDRDAVIEALCAGVDGDVPELRSCCIAALARLGKLGPTARRRLAAALEDPDPDIRGDAAMATAALRLDEAVEALVARMQGDADGEVRMQATAALGAIAAPRSLPALVDCLSHEGYPALDDPVDDDEFMASWEVQAQALKALGEIGDARALPAVLAVVEDPELDDLQELAFQVLARLDGAAARQAVLARLGGEDPRARRRAARALVQLPEIAAGGGSLAPDVAALLPQLLDDRDPIVRIGVIRALGACGDPAYVAPLVGLLVAHDAEVREAVVAVLSQCGDAALEPRLLELLTFRDERVRQGIVRVLGHVGGSASVAPLAALLDGAGPELQRDVARALAAIGRPGGERALLVCLGDADADIHLRVEALRALHPGDDQDDAARSALLTAIGDSDERICHAGATTLARFDSHAAVTRLIAILAVGAETPEAPEQQGTEMPAEIAEWVCESAAADPASSTLAAMIAAEPEEAPPAAEPVAEESEAPQRVVAARLLGLLGAGDSRVPAALIAATRTAFPDFRAQALAALAGLDDAGAVPAAVAGLAAAEPTVRLAALATAEAYAETTETVAGASALLGDADTDIRARAVRFLARCEGEAAEAALLQGLNDTETDVCREALRGLTAEHFGEAHRDATLVLLFRPDGSLARDAVAALRRLGDARSLAKLMHILSLPEYIELHGICIESLAGILADVA